MSDLDWLESWYAAQCNDKWEHRYGVTIETLDNPGWVVRIDLVGTNLEAAAIDGELARIGEPPELADGGTVIDARTPQWMICRIVAKRFEGAGDASQLRAILAAFRRWAMPAGE